MEPDVIRMYSSSPPPMEDGAEEEDDEFGDFGTFSGIPNSISFSEFDTPTTFNQTQALTATSPPELINSRGVVGFSHSSTNGARKPSDELSKANGVVPASASERTEMKKVLASSVDLTASDTADCNGGSGEVLTNGFDVQGSPSSQNSVHDHIKGTSPEDTGSAGSPEDDFADFAAFSDADGRLDQMASSHCPLGVSHNVEQGPTSEDNVRDTKRTENDRFGSESPCVLAETPDRRAHMDADSRQRDVALAVDRGASEVVCTDKPLIVNRADLADSDGSKDGCGEKPLLPDATTDGEAAQSDEKSSGNETETETETETSFGRPLSTDALEEYGDMSTTGSVPSPPLQGESATPADDSQMAEDGDEDFGDFGDAGSFGAQGFADFDQLEVQHDPAGSQSSALAQEAATAKDNAAEEDDFGDFNSPKFHLGGNEGEEGGKFADFPVSDSFGNFSSASGGESNVGWSAFGEQQEEEEEEGAAWAAFSAETSVSLSADSRGVEEQEEEWHESKAPAVAEEPSSTDRQPASLFSRLEKLFQVSFPQSAAQPVEDQVVSLKVVLEPPEDRHPGAEEKEEGKSKKSTCNRSVHGGVWTQLQDIHESFGLRYQWGGSHCNKALLCCLGIDTRNILFTGQKKQPVIVPMYAAGLGMLEPTKEPVKPVSAAEMIASIAQAPPLVPEKSSCPADSVQEALPPVQFDWSSSGLTNPLDGVDPELFELTTTKLDSGSSGSRMADAFARLMSTVEKTSTSTRKPRKDENLSEEAAKVIAVLPDLSFMQAKVLMFPATLTPLGSHATPD